MNIIPKNYVRNSIIFIIIIIIIIIFINTKRTHMASLRYFKNGVRNTDKITEIPSTDQWDFTKRLKNESHINQEN